MSDVQIVAIVVGAVLVGVAAASLVVFGALLMWSGRRRAPRERASRLRRPLLFLLALYAVVNLGNEGRSLPPDREHPRWMEQATDVELVGGAWRDTRASYTNARPRYCYDRRGRHRVPNVSLWTAHPSLPCGTALEVRRNGRRVVVRVFDHGPNQRVHAERDLDLSRAAFARLDNPSRGVIAVWWRVA